MHAWHPDFRDTGHSRLTWPWAAGTHWASVSGHGHSCVGSPLIGRRVTAHRTPGHDPSGTARDAWATGGVRSTGHRDSREVRRPRHQDAHSETTGVGNREASTPGRPRPFRLGTPGPRLIRLRSSAAPNWRANTRPLRSGRMVTPHQRAKRWASRGPRPALVAAALRLRSEFPDNPPRHHTAAHRPVDLRSAGSRGTNGWGEPVRGDASDLEWGKAAMRRTWPAGSDSGALPFSGCAPSPHKGRELEHSARARGLDEAGGVAILHHPVRDEPEVLPRAARRSLGTR